VGLAGLKADLEAMQKADARFDANWAIVTNWTEAARYETVEALVATAMVNAVTHQNSGVLAWLKTHW
jgi:hypothetical protein